MIHPLLLLKQTQYDVLQLILHWQLRHSRNFTSLRMHTPRLAGDRYTVRVWLHSVGVGAPTVTECHILIQPPTLEHTNRVTSCVPVRRVRPSSCRPCCPSFW